MAILPAETRATVRTEIARSVGALEATGVVDSATGTGMTAAAELGNYVSADRLKGLQVVIKSGTGAVAGNERLATASTTGGVLTVATWDTTPVAADTFDIYRPSIADKDMLDLALKNAIEVAQDQFLLDWEDVASIVLKSITLNGGFEDWTSGTSVAPDKWTKVEAGSTIGRESDIILPPFRYSCKFLNAGSAVGTLRQQNANLSYPYEFLASKSLTASAYVYTTTASRVTIRWTNDGSTYNSSSAHGGTGWEKLSVAAADVGASPTELTAELRISTGAQITTYVHDFRLVPANVNIYEYYLPKKFLLLAKLWHESGTDFQWDRQVNQGYYSIDRARERIVFDSRIWLAPDEYRVRLVGQTYQAVPTADSDSIDLPLAYLIAQARSFLVSMGRASDDVLRQAGYIHEEAFRLKQQLRRRPMTSARRVR